MKVFPSWQEVVRNADLVRETFEKGGIIVFPDESFFVFGVLPFSKGAVERAYELAERISKTPQKPPPYILLGDIKLSSRFVFFSVQEKFIIRMFWTYPVIIAGRTNVHLRRFIIRGAKMGLRFVFSEGLKNLTSVCGGMIGVFPLSRGGLPIATREELESSVIPYLSDSDICFAVPCDRRGFPTYLELFESLGVRVIFEGMVTRVEISEKLGRFGFKVI